MLNIGSGIGIARVDRHELTVSSRLYLPKAASSIFLISSHPNNLVLAIHSHQITIVTKLGPSMLQACAQVRPLAWA
jgi:hypothetical protein